MNNKAIAVLIAGASGLQFVVSFVWTAFMLFAYDYLTEKGYTFLQIVTVFAILTAFYRAMRTMSLLYSPPDRQSL